MSEQVGLGVRGATRLKLAASMSFGWNAAPNARLSATTRSTSRYEPTTTTSWNRPDPSISSRSRPVECHDRGVVVVLRVVAADDQPLPCRRHQPPEQGVEVAFVSLVDEHVEADHGISLLSVPRGLEAQVRPLRAGDLQSLNGRVDSHVVGSRRWRVASRSPQPMSRTSLSSKPKVEYSSSRCLTARDDPLEPNPEPRSGSST